MSRIDIFYSITSYETGYNSIPIVAISKVLNYLMQYLYHHPHVPTMYQRRSKKNDETLHAHVAYGQDQNYETNSLTLLEGYTDADLGRDLMNRR